MADNVTADPGTGGAVLAADDISSVFYPRAKLSLGADGTAVDAGAGAGAVGTDTQRVTLGSDDPAVASLAIIDDWDESDRAKVNPIAGQAGVAAGAGAVGATVQRTTLASDDPAVALLTTIDSDTNTIQGDTTSIDGKITACNTGAVVLAAGTAEIGKLAAGVAEIGKLAAGTAAIGKLAANSGVDIGDVDVTSLPASIAGPAAIAVDSYTQVAINLTTAANQVLVSSAPNKQIWVYGYQFSCGSAAGTGVSFQDEDDAALSGIMLFAQYGGASVTPSGNFAMPIWKLGTDKDLEIDITGGDVDGWITYAILSV